ncbi:DUF3267 domain-containing protein [Arabiibacter massiliensis]|uniref:DUF3267 domain-containing protein n=1 Tax=Arabiibacter massiliensis TaxID=1870985 RepID=UPI0009BBDB80|nr:DUF3267 domain-containing protein [Arabiibacter massiliensis]
MGQKERTLTKAELARMEAFERTCADFEEQGFRSHPLVIGVVAANLGAVVLSLPIIAVLGVGFFALHPSGAGSLGPWGLLILSASFLVLAAVHELIHGLVWSAFAKSGWKAVSFGVIWQYLTPYCTCSEPLPKHAYVIGALAPTVVLGLLPVLVSYATGSLVWFGVGALMILGGGGDLAVVLKLLRFKPAGDEAVFLDHACDCGLMAFER